MNILITGGTGSLGSLLAEKYAKRGDTVTILSRDAHKQHLLLNKINVRAVLGDICDRGTVQRAVRGQNIVIHAAALKRVERGATDPVEYLRVNTLGAEVVADEAQRAGVNKFLLISTDKAPSPTTLYGMTKALAEQVCLSYRYLGLRVAALRYGNVMDSNGSFWWVWQDKLAAGEPIEVRYPYPTRFILTRRQAVQLVDDALDSMRGGEIFVPAQIHAVALDDIARALTPESNWLKRPLLPTEKQHEVLIGEMEHCRLVAPTLASVTNVGYDDGLRPLMCSATAPRLSGAEAVELLRKESL